MAVELAHCTRKTLPARDAPNSRASGAATIASVGAVLRLSLPVEANPVCGLRRRHAISRASLNSDVCMCGCRLHPTTGRLCSSNTTARYSHPSSVALSSVQIGLGHPA